MTPIMQGTVPLSCRYRWLQERVLVRDLEHLSRYPEAPYYDRPVVPGEAWPVVIPDEVTTVRVLRVTLAGRPYRARLFFDASGTAREVPRC